MTYEYDRIYKERLRTGLEYQDFVAEQLYKIGLPIFNYASKKYQIECGENKLGVEIKYDAKFASTGNLYIELQEKTNPQNSNYIDSGINRNDNSWLYIIGNYNTIYIFSKRLLNQIASKYKSIENNTKTSIGFLLPKLDAEKYAARIILI